MYGSAQIPATHVELKRGLSLSEEPCFPGQGRRETFMLLMRVLALLLTLCGDALAQERTYKLGPLVIETPWARATSAGAKVGAGYAKITNTGQESDRLLGGSLPLATEVEVDETVMSNG